MSMFHTEEAENQLITEENMNTHNFSPDSSIIHNAEPSEIQYDSHIILPHAHRKSEIQSTTASQSSSTTDESQSISTMTIPDDNIQLQTEKEQQDLEWECYHCGLVNLQDSLCCGACFQECIYNEYDGDSDNEASKNQSSNGTLEIIKFIANNSLKFMNAKQIQLRNVSEELANENLGSQRLFGMFGDVRKIEIIRKKKSKKIKAVITYYAPDSVSALMKLSSSYHNFKIFSLY